LNIYVISLFPEMFDAVINYGISARAVKRKLIKITCINLRDFSNDKHQKVDDRPFGGGPGMVMQIQPLESALNFIIGNLATQKYQVIYLSPQGVKLNQNLVNNLVLDDNLILIAGRYEGIDERFICKYVDQEISIGDYVLSGGELPAMVLIDAIIRQIPGSLGHNCSALQDSFSDGLLDFPQYTRPKDYAGCSVPDVLLSGNHEQIRRWRLQQSLIRTKRRRPDLLDCRSLSGEEKLLLDEYSNNFTLNNDGK